MSSSYIFTRPGSGARSVLTQADFTYLGRFDIADTYGSKSTLDGTALGGRYVGGNLRFFITAYGPGYYFDVLELNNPGYAMSSQPTATLSRDWGDIYDGKRTLDFTGTPEVMGLYWDATDSRLYWSFGNDYGTHSDDNCLGYSTLNDGTGASTGFGPWKSSSGYKASQGGISPVPSDFIAAHLTTGQRLALGFGGYYNSVANGPASMGPALFAFAPASLPSEGSTVTVETLLNYAYNAVEYTNPDRMHRSTDYSIGFADGWLPNAGVGYWQWSDVIKQGGWWIQNATKEGIVYAGLLGTGELIYFESDREAESGKHFMCVYDPAELGEIADGTRQPYATQPELWYEQFSVIDYPLEGWRGDGTLKVLGMFYDSTTRLLYIRLKYAGVMVYSVAD